MGPKAVMFTNSSHAVSILLHVWDVDVLDGHHWTVWCVHGSAVYPDGKGCNKVHLNDVLHSMYDNWQENTTVSPILITITQYTGNKLYWRVTSSPFNRVGARQNSQYPQHKFWRALSAEHASALAEYHFSPVDCDVIFHI